MSVRSVFVVSWIRIPSLLLVSSVLLYEYPVVCLSILVSMNKWATSSFQLL